MVLILTVTDIRYKASYPNKIGPVSTWEKALHVVLRQTTIGYIPSFLYILVNFSPGIYLWRDVTDIKGLKPYIAS